MLPFKKLELGDIDKILPYLSHNISKFSEFTIGVIFMWRNYLKIEFCIENEILYLKSRYYKNNISFTLPCCEQKNMKAAMIRLLYHCTEANEVPRFIAVSEKELLWLKSEFNVTCVLSERDTFDYVYKSSDMCEFVGKKFHGQRNHINKFKRLYPNYRFEEICDENIDEIKSFCKYYAEAFKKETSISEEENSMVLDVLENYHTYGFFGGVVKTDEGIVGFSVGEIIGDTLYVHIEKADIKFPGAYQIVVNEFAKHFVTNDVHFINREDDVGDEGLRQSKLSYHPIEIPEKYIIKIEK